MVRPKMGKPDRAVSKSGQNIFFYRHIRSNQVLYSLERVLNNNAAIKQLPNVGANNTIPKLRKDLWQPFLTVSFPPDRASQGLNAWRKLREYRRLHETNWEPPAILSRPLSEDQIAVFEKKLNAKTGSKKQDVGNLIKRWKKKIRVNEVMDQKANSVADLAAVLIEQDESGVHPDDAQALDTQRTTAARAKEVEEMLALASEASMDGVAKIDLRMQDLKQKLEQYTASNDAKASPTRRSLNKLAKKRERMVFVSEVVDTLRARHEASTANPDSPDAFAAIDARVSELREGAAASVGKALAEVEGSVKDSEEEAAASGEEPSRGHKAALTRLLEKREKLVFFADALEKVKAGDDASSDALNDIHARVEDSSKRAARSTKGKLSGYVEAAFEDLSKESRKRESLVLFHDALKEVKAGGEELSDGLANFNAHVRVLVEQGGKAFAAKDEVQRRAYESSLAELTKERESVEFIEEAKAKNPNLLDLATKESRADTAFWSAVLPSFPGHLAASLAPVRTREDGPVMAAEGVSIRWANLLDAEFAEEWPAGVTHSALGFTRHTAPAVHKEPVLRVEDWNTYKSGPLAEVSEKAAKKQERDAERVERDAERVDIVKGEILERVRALRGVDARVIASSAAVQQRQIEAFGDVVDVEATEDSAELVRSL